jgi:hypothetical protein
MILDFLKEAGQLSDRQYAIAYRQALLNDPGKRLHKAFSAVVCQEETRLGIDYDSLWKKLRQAPGTKPLVDRRDEIDAQYPNLNTCPERIHRELLLIENKLRWAELALRGSPEVILAREEAYRIAKEKVTLPEPGVDLAAKVYATYALKRYSEALSNEETENHPYAVDFEKFLGIMVDHFMCLEANITSDEDFLAREKAEKILRWMKNTGQLAQAHKPMEFIRELDVESAFAEYQENPQDPKPNQDGISPQV